MEHRALRIAYMDPQYVTGYVPLVLSRRWHQRGRKIKPYCFWKRNAPQKYLCTSASKYFCWTFPNCNKGSGFNPNATYHRLRDTLQRNKHHQPSAYDPGKNIFGVNETNDTVLWKNTREKVLPHTFKSYHDAEEGSPVTRTVAMIQVKGCRQRREEQSLMFNMNRNHTTILWVSRHTTTCSTTTTKATWTIIRGSITSTTMSSLHLTTEVGIGSTDWREREQSCSLSEHWLAYS